MPPFNPQQSAQGAGAPMRLPVSIPPHVQQHVDPTNPVQAELLQRIDALSPQEIQAFAAGVSPAAVAVLKKVLPEFAFLLDRIGKGGPPGPGGSAAPAAPGGMPGGAGNGPMPAPPMAGSAAGPAGPVPGGMPMPRTKLADF